MPIHLYVRRKVLTFIIIGVQTFPVYLVYSDRIRAAPSSGSRRSRCTRIITVGFGNLPFFLGSLLLEENNSGLPSIIAEAGDVELDAASGADCGGRWRAEYLRRRQMSVNEYYNVF